MIELDRFIKAQKKSFGTAKYELLNKKKESHWMWFMFPQLKGLGMSWMSNYYGIESLDDASEYFENTYLKQNLIELTNIIANYGNVNIEDVFGNTDAKKLCSCMTLFLLATNEECFRKVIFKYFIHINPLIC